MDTQQVSAPSRTPSAGVVHINIRLTDGYSIISNRLSQHRDMSLLAIGLGTHIQSLPAGSRIGVKALAEIFPESEARIAAALRELEHHGFLRRIRERVQGGRVATRTESYNHPEAAARRAGAARVSPAVRVTPAAPAAPVVPVVPAVPVATSAPAPAPAPVPVRVPECEPAPVPVPASEPPVVREPVPDPAPRLVPSPAAPKPPPPPLPFPRRPSAPLFDEAARLLAGLQVSAPLFVLSEVDVERLTPGVAAWLERGVRPDAVRVALTDDPPVPLRHPAKLVRHRLVALLPPPVPAAVPVVSLQNCDDCDRGFRSPVPGRCGECRDVRAYADDGPCLLGG
ncbi:hypothetical protein [Streptomyces anulatus]|uniref:hypothetical protein n=1 Tax=Streptomyces anulatus TaxID=1892 RepID=UPI0035DDE42F